MILTKEIIKKDNHLYVLSDKEIENNDWCYDTLRNCFRRKSDKITCNGLIYKKIIATTDETLKLTNGMGKGKAVKKYFEGGNTTGTYLFWKGSHITIIVNKTVHEFGHSAGGYKTKPIDKRASDNTDYYLYKLPADKQF